MKFQIGVLTLVSLVLSRAGNSSSSTSDGKLREPLLDKQHAEEQLNQRFPGDIPDAESTPSYIKNDRLKFNEMLPEFFGDARRQIKNPEWVDCKSERKV